MHNVTIPDLSCFFY